METYNDQGKIAFSYCRLGDKIQFFCYHEKY